MQCTLNIPHLIPPREADEGVWQEVNAPRLKTALARAAYASDANADAEALLCEWFGVPRQQDWPLAPLLAKEDGLPASIGYWLCATPLHLETRRNALVAASTDQLPIGESESAAFAATLAGHLQSEGIALYAPAPGRWYLSSDNAPALTTTPMDVVAGRDIRAHLPTGKDSARWRRILTEMQMLLHSHPVNEVRESRGLPPINSVWLWGGGTLPPAPAKTQTPFTSVNSNDAAIRALAHHAGCRVKPLPEQCSPALLDEMTAANSTPDETHLISIESLATAMCQGDALAWTNAAHRLEALWIAPLLDALKLHRLRTLTLVSSNRHGIWRFEVRSSDRWKVWRKMPIVD